MNREQLLASLTAGHEDLTGVYYDGDLTGVYIDWSSELHADDDPDRVIGRMMEIHDGEVHAQMEMPWDRIERLQRALTLLLLERQN